MSSVHSVNKPNPICGTQGGPNTSFYASDWSGYVVPYNLVSPSTFNEISTTFTVPSVPGNPSYSNYQTAPRVSIWAGIGVSDLLQAGVSSIATGTPQYRFWTEDFPTPQGVIWEGPIISPGQSAYVFIEYLGNGNTYYYLENEAPGGQAQAFENPTPDVGANQANFIAERGNGLYLPDYGSSYQSFNYFVNQQGTSYYLTSGDDPVTMTSNCESNGTVLSYPGSVNNSNGAFTQYFNQGTPYNNTCGINQ